MVHQEVKEENEIILEFQEKEIELKITLELVLPNVSQIYSCAL